MADQTELIIKGLSENQRKAAEARNCDVIVRAGAGSGKTKTLVARYLLLLNENRAWKPEDITAVTFTRKAAREMQSRIREQMLTLASFGTDEEEQRFWLKKLTEMDNACIGTIHSLCARILRAHPAETGLDPEFSVLDGNQGSLLMEDVITETISKISGIKEYKPLLGFYTESSLRNILKAMLGDRNRIDKAVSVQTESVRETLVRKLKYYLYESDFPGFIDNYREMIRSENYEKTAGKIADNIRNLVKAFDDARDLEKGGADPIDCLSVLYAPFRGWSFSLGSARVKADAKAIRDLLEKEQPFLSDEDHNIAWYRENWKKSEEADICLRKLWPVIGKAYQSALDARGTIDFNEMEAKTLQLLHENTEVRILWQDRIKSLLVDEYQDTNEEQAELFALLDPDHDRLFAVGDKKQSIYGFRGTNVALFDERGKKVKQTNGQDIALDVTYRTVPELLDPMGKLLDGVMFDGDLQGKEHYAPYEAMKPGKQPSGNSGPVIEILLGEPEPRKSGSDFVIAAQALAERLDELKASGKINSWNEAAVLCRRSNDFKFYEAAFTERRIPYVTVSGKGFYDRPEIREVKNILKAAENPFDNAALSGFLFSPVIGFTPVMMLRLYEHANSGKEKHSFHHALMDETFHFDDADKQQKLVAARKIFRNLNHLAGQVPVDEVLEELYRQTGIRTMLSMEHTERAWKNLDKLLVDARNSGIASVTEFLEYLDMIDDSGAREGEAPSDKEGAVRIMTIHQAKGLEFPITIIANANTGMNSRSRALYLDSAGGVVFSGTPASPKYILQKAEAEEIEKSEWLRLFYVAATRAEKRLIICGNKPSETGKTDSWLKRVMEQIPSEYFDEEEYSGPAFGQDTSVLFFRHRTEPPEITGNDSSEEFGENRIVPDTSLLMPILARPFTINREDHSFSLAVGNMVHKGLELWRFPDDPSGELILKEAFDNIVLSNERLDRESCDKALEKAMILLRRFRSSEVYDRINQAEKRWHELPFSLPGRGFTVNGVIDVLLEEQNGKYTVIDFKTDELKSAEELNQAVKDHEKQLRGYRRAVQMTLGKDPELEVCFLDYCGTVRCEKIGKGTVSEEQEDLSSLDPDEFPEDTDWDDGFDSLPVPEPVDLDRY